jgi:hypothetical protein
MMMIFGEKTTTILDDDADLRKENDDDVFREEDDDVLRRK